MTVKDDHAHCGSEQLYVRQLHRPADGLRHEVPGIRPSISEDPRLQALNRQYQSRARGAKLLQSHPTKQSNIDLAVEAERRRPPTLLVVIFHVSHQKLANFLKVKQLLSFKAVCQNILVAAQAVGFLGQWFTVWPAYYPQVIQNKGHDEGTQIVGSSHIGSVRWFRIRGCGQVLRRC